MEATMRIIKKENKFFKGYSIWIYGPKAQLAFVAVSKVDDNKFFVPSFHSNNISILLDSLEAVRIYLLRNATLYFKKS